MNRYLNFSLLIWLCLIGGQVIAQNFQADASIWLNTWTSCERSQNPIAENGNSHWIQYDFGTVRRLSKTWVWNSNDPSKLDQGFNRVKVDYSLDGENWTHWGEMNFPKAKGEAVYSGFPGPDLVDIEAQYVLITPLTNHGHPSCFGLAEIKFNLLTPKDTTTIRNEDDDEEEGDCLAIEAFFIEELLSTEAFFVWDYPDDASFFFEYRISGQEEWIGMETDEFEVFLENLKEGTTYEYRLTVECDEDIYTATEIRTFTTLSCEGIEGVQVTMLEEDVVGISWEELAGVEEYVIAYGTVDAEEPIFLETNNLAIYLEDLEPDTEYELAIGIYCGEDDMIWSETIFFTTSSVVTNVNNLVKAKDTDVLLVYPNPTQGQLMFRYETKESDLLNYALYDVSGKMLYQNHFRLNRGQNQVMMNIHNYKDGVYLLKTLTMSKRVSKVVRIVKTK